MDQTTSVEEREAQYWDSVTSQYSDQDLLRMGTGDTPTTRRIVAMLGDVKGKKVLDVGCGTGAWAVKLAQDGAEVWAVDISPESIRAAERRAALGKVTDRVHASVMSATEMTFEDGFFDAVYGMDIVHHLDAAAFGAEIARVLKPGGRAVFNENNAINPILMFARNNICGRFGIAKWSSDDEYPLTVERRKIFASSFEQSRFEYPEFKFFHYFNAKVFKYRSKPMNFICDGLDNFIYKAMPFLRSHSYRQLVYVEGPRKTA